tara:strand:+ start:372 stop:560 length:189 start_codon:yes stop_codon:yes gene_type:complete
MQTASTGLFTGTFDDLVKTVNELKIQKQKVQHHQIYSNIETKKQQIYSNIRETDKEQVYENL